MAQHTSQKTLTNWLQKRFKKISTNVYVLYRDKYNPVVVYLFLTQFSSIY